MADKAKNHILTPKRDRFCLEYVKDLNGKQAAIRAGFSAKTAESQASRLLRNAKVKARIAELQSGVSKKLGLTQDGVRPQAKQQQFEPVGAGQVGAFIDFFLE